MNNGRLAIAALSLSAAGFGVIVGHEGFTNKAVVPVPGDRFTYGFGSTFKADGSPVKMGDTISAPQAVRLSISHIAKDESVLKQCVTAPLSQVEYDILTEFAYWRGAAGACRSDVVRHLNAGRYADACAAYLTYRRAAGKDCSDPANKCRGVWLRAQERHAKCMAAQ